MHYRVCMPSWCISFVPLRVFSCLCFQHIWLALVHRFARVLPHCFSFVWRFTEVLNGVCRMPEQCLAGSVRRRLPGCVLNAMNSKCLRHIAVAFVAAWTVLDKQFIWLCKHQFCHTHWFFTFELCALAVMRSTSNRYWSTQNLASLCNSVVCFNAGVVFGFNLLCRCVTWWLLE